MKKLLAVLVSVVSLHAFAQDSPKFLHVLAANGLNMRSQPNGNARVLTKVPYGKAVEVLEITKVELQLGWVSDHWYRVRFRGREGFIFGGYLSHLPAPMGLDSIGLISDLIPAYCSQHFQLDAEPVHSTEAVRGGDTLFHSFLEFKCGAELDMERQGDRHTSVLLLPTDVQAVHVLLEALLKASGNADLLDDLRYVKGKDGHLIRINNADGTLSVRKRAEQLTELQMTAFGQNP